MLDFWTDQMEVLLHLTVWHICLFGYSAVLDKCVNHCMYLEH